MVLLFERLVPQVRVLQDANLGLVTTITASLAESLYPQFMPTGLERWPDTGQSHFVTFSCPHRERKYVRREDYQLFLVCREEMRRRFGMRVYG